jgi:hypothetical protein
MSNRPRRHHPRHRKDGGRLVPASYMRDELNDVCIFCELAQNLDFLRTRTIPGVPRIFDDQDRADQLAASMQRDLAELQQMLEGELGHG